jgi:hypothetical protein
MAEEEEEAEMIHHHYHQQQHRPQEEDDGEEDPLVPKGPQQQPRRVTYATGDSGEDQEGNDDGTGHRGERRKKKQFKPRTKSVSCIPSLPNIPKYRRAAGILAKAVNKPTETVDQLLAKLPSLKKEDDRRRARKAALVRHQHLLEKPKPAEKSSGGKHGIKMLAAVGRMVGKGGATSKWGTAKRTDSEGFLSDDEDDNKVQTLIQTVLAFKAPEEDPRHHPGGGGSGGGHHQSGGDPHHPGGPHTKTTMSGLKIVEDD